MSARRRNGFILLLVLGLMVASAAVVATKDTKLGLDLKGGVELVYEGRPTPQQPTVDAEAIDRALDIMRERVDQFGVAEPELQRSGRDQISVALPEVTDAERAIEQVGTTAQLYFYDWEPNVIGQDGEPAPDDPSVTGGAQAGTPAIALSLYDAVERASKRERKNYGTQTDQWYLFNKDTRQLVAGPTAERQDLFDDLEDLPRNEIPPKEDRQVFQVKRGTIVVKAEQPDDAPEAAPDRYYVLNDQPALGGTDIKNPEQTFDQGAGGSGGPIVSMEFTDDGRRKFQDVTRAIAQRGVTAGSPTDPPEAKFQHFAIVLDDELVSTPFIDFNQNPDGIDGRTGAQISGGFTIESAQDLAQILRIGALPIELELISQSQVSATLGQEALDQGLAAGAAGFAIVALFLLVFYRVLGVIAVAALAIYGLYFFALVKLIPITLTLPGIAGLILTIGVAADANIVIFERVKEEIRGGRSIQAGIAAGYKKGLSAIIDANVVTIMVAFILFILATAGVKGFAFMLGIGVIVSLFTAVLATQAILGTMGRSRLLYHRSALGAGEQRVRFRWNFIGASRWFFSMSGVILLICALAIGGKGIDFGIDFESGTRVKTALEQPATVDQVRGALETVGQADAEIQEVQDPELGQNVVQISTETLAPDEVSRVTNALDEEFGVVGEPNSQSVGPTFGETVANSAVIAIIASLLVISAYLALRFEPKYAVPVLIAVTHDILITAGVYALADREVTTATVAALLTILGFSLYDTIIVFDRIRENVPRMPRAAFSQIVNRSMSEVLTRSLATSLVSGLPMLALMLFGGETLRDFAFALLVGTISGTYSSVFIASPVLTHWKEREPVYAARIARIKAEFGGVVPAFAGGEAALEVEPEEKPRRRTGRISDQPGEISQSEFQELVRDIEPEVGGGAAAPLPPGARPAGTMPGRKRRPERTAGNGAPEAEGDGRSEPKPPKEKKPRNRRHGRAR